MEVIDLMHILGSDIGFTPDDLPETTLCIFLGLGLARKGAH